MYKNVIIELEMSDWGGEQHSSFCLVIFSNLYCTDFDMLCNNRLNKQFVFRDTLLSNLLGI